MKYWFDTEFLERPFSLQLVSIGIVAEDGREFYAESCEVDWSQASQWALDHLRPHLTGHGANLEDISYRIRNFVDGDDHPQFWGYYSAFDWVIFCGLFGGLGELPFRFPQFCFDIRQWQAELGDPQLPAQDGRKHHALADAHWTRDAWNLLALVEAKESLVRA